MREIVRLYGLNASPEPAPRPGTDNNKIGTIANVYFV